METLGSIKKEILTLLKSDTRFAQAKIVTAFAGEPYGMPREHPLVVVGIQKVDIAPGGLGGYLGHQAGQQHHGLQAEIVLQIDVYLPKEQSGDWDLLQEGLYELLLSSPLGITGVRCEPLTAQGATHTTKATALANLQTLLTVSTQTQPIASVVLQHSLEKEAL